MQDRKREDEQDAVFFLIVVKNEENFLVLYLAYHAACDPAYPVILYDRLCLRAFFLEFKISKLALMVKLESTPALQTLREITVFLIQYQCCPFS